MGQNCPHCTESYGEKVIREILISNNIQLIPQKTFNGFYFDDNRRAKPRFDFYLPDFNLLIEYDGEQHFKPHAFGSDQSEGTKRGNLLECQRRDSIKTQYCIDNNIRLLRISYLDVDMISDILIDNGILK